MSNQLFNEIGLNLPSGPGYIQAQGATILHLTDFGGVSRLRGEAVAMSHSVNLSDTSLSEAAVGFTHFETSPVTGITSGAIPLVSKVFGLLLEDIPANGSGLVMLRGTAFGLVQRVTSNIGAGANSALVSVNNVGARGALVAAQDAGAAGSYFKVIAQYRGLSSFTVAGSALRPVTFNGVEGFWSGEL